MIEAHEERNALQGGAGEPQEASEDQIGRCVEILVDARARAGVPISEREAEAVIRSVVSPSAQEAAERALVLNVPDAVDFHLGRNILERMRGERGLLGGVHPIEPEIVESDPADKDPAQAYSDEQLIAWRTAQGNNVCAVCLGKGNRRLIKVHTVPDLRRCIRKMSEAMKRKQEAEAQAAPQASGAPTRGAVDTRPRAERRREQRMLKAEASGLIREINRLGTKLSDLISANGSQWSADERSSYSTAIRELERVRDNREGADPDNAREAARQAKEILTAGIQREEAAAIEPAPAPLDSSLPRGDDSASDQEASDQ